MMKKRILVVEDDAELRELLRMNFRAAGFSVATAGNGIDALTKTRSVCPDLVLLDLVLPELDGFAVCESLRRAQGMDSVPIIVLTGLSSELARLAVLESGANDYVMKPAAPSELVTKMRHWLRHPPHPMPASAAPRTRPLQLLTRVE
jgi:DNA-binding response OmpR family regulator